MSRPVKIPGPDHPITVTPARGRVTVIAAGRTIADTRAALILKEAAYPPVYYIPRVLSGWAPPRPRSPAATSRCSRTRAL